MPRSLFLAFVLPAVAACGGGSSTTDASMDATGGDLSAHDSGVDAGDDAAPPTDLGVDAPSDSGVDAPTECVAGATEPCYSGDPRTRGVGACTDGHHGCTAAGTWETTCTGEVLPILEVCDAIDDDCNGMVDDGDPGGGSACSTGLLGACTAGTMHCTSGALTCVPNVTASVEVCDGVDNDCNGAVDEGDPGGGSACATGLLGACSAGTTHCSFGAIACAPNVMPSTEVCDGVDNDCNGAVDEGDPGGGSACMTGLFGACSAGTMHCALGALTCQQNVTSSPEVCDGVDNDCNGVVDEGSLCGGSGATESCTMGRCVVVSCSAGFSDCDMTASNGCECVTPACCGSGCQTTHGNGLGQSYFDCGALGTPGTASTYAVTMATEARAVWTGVGTDATGGCGVGPTSQCVTRTTTTECAVWCYSGPLAGHVLLTPSTMCMCPTTASPTWN